MLTFTGQVSYENSSTPCQSSLWVTSLIQQTCQQYKVQTYFGISRQWSYIITYHSYSKTPEQRTHWGRAICPLYREVLFSKVTNPKTIQVHHAHSVHQSTRRSLHNSVKLDVHSLGWNDTRCVTYAWHTLDCNRKFSEIKHSKMLKLVHNLQCRSKVGDFIGDFINQ